MKIKILVPLSGGFDIGEEVDWDDADAENLIRAGYAEPISDQRKKPAKRGTKTAALKGAKETR